VIIETDAEVEILEY